MGHPLLSHTNALQPARMAVGRFDVCGDQRDALVQGLDPVLQASGDGVRLFQREIAVQFEVEIDLQVLPDIVVELGHVYVMYGLDLHEVGRFRSDLVHQVGRFYAVGLCVHHDHGVVDPLPYPSGELVRDPVRLLQGHDLVDEHGAIDVDLRACLPDPDLVHSPDLPDSHRLVSHKLRYPLRGTIHEGMDRALP